jgi:hypothetical protein
LIDDSGHGEMKAGLNVLNLGLVTWQTELFHMRGIRRIPHNIIMCFQHLCPMQCRHKMTGGTALGMAGTDGRDSLMTGKAIGVIGLFGLPTAAGGRPENHEEQHQQPPGCLLRLEKKAAENDDHLRHGIPASVSNRCFD